MSWSSINILHACSGCWNSPLADSNAACTQCYGGGSAAVVLQRTKIELGTGNGGGPSQPRLGNEVARCRGRGNQISRAKVIHTVGTIGDDSVGNVNGAITVEPTSPSGSIA